MPVKGRQRKVLDKGKESGSGHENGVSLVAEEDVSVLLDMDAVTKLVTQLLDQQKSHYTELLKNMTDHSNNFMQMMMKATNERLDTMTRNIQELKDSIQFTQKEVDDIKTKVTKNTNYNYDLEKNLKVVCDGLVCLEKKTDYLENQSRRNNLVFEGIEEAVDETWAVSEAKVREVFTKVLKLNPEHANSIAIKRAHRTGRRDDRKGRSRPVVVKFRNFRDRERILSVSLSPDRKREKEYDSEGHRYLYQ